MINCLPLFFLFPFPPSLFTSPRTSQSLGLKTERAFQKQPTISHNRKGGLKKAEQRFVVSPGLGFKVPREVVLHPFLTLPKCFKVLIRVIPILRVDALWQIENNQKCMNVFCMLRCLPLLLGFPLIS